MNINAELYPIYGYNTDAATWTIVNPVLPCRQIGFETDTLAFKIGDGMTAWNDLNYFGTISQATLTALVNNIVTAEGKTTAYSQATQPVGVTAGDMWFDTSNGNRLSIYNGTEWVLSQFGNEAVVNLDASSITTGYLSADRIEASSLDASVITANTITAAEIAARTITAIQIAADTITANEIATGTITAESGLIADLTIGTAQIQVGAITTALINTAAVTTAQIADGSITNAKIVDLTADKITAGTLSVSRLIITGSDQSIVFAVNEANGTAQLSQTTIDGGSLTQRTITADRIVAGAITANEIASRTITANNIVAGAITANEIKSGTITATQIATGTITAANILAGTITAASGIIADAAITSAKIASLVADKIQGGTLTLGGASNTSGVLNLENALGTIIGTFDNTGISLLTGGDLTITTIIGTSTVISQLSNGGFSVTDNLSGGGSSTLLLDVGGLSLTNASYSLSMELLSTGPTITTTGGPLTINGIALLLLAYPIGSIYLSVNSTNPGTLFGGTWVAWGAGRVPLGMGTGTDSDSVQKTFSTVETTAGEYSHTLVNSEVPLHSHGASNNYMDKAAMTGTTTNRMVLCAGGATTPGGVITDTQGGGGSHNNLQPYITCYMWKRTA